MNVPFRPLNEGKPENDDARLVVDAANKGVQSKPFGGYPDR